MAFLLLETAARFRVLLRAGPKRSGKWTTETGDAAVYNYDHYDRSRYRRRRRSPRPPLAYFPSSYSTPKVALQSKYAHPSIRLDVLFCAASAPPAAHTASVRSTAAPRSSARPRFVHDSRSSSVSNLVVGSIAVVISVSSVGERGAPIASRNESAAPTSSSAARPSPRRAASTPMSSSRNASAQRSS